MVGTDERRHGRVGDGVVRIEINFQPIPESSLALMKGHD